jgi:hypothetical protein
MFFGPDHYSRSVAQASYKGENGVGVFPPVYTERDQDPVVEEK